MPGRAFGVKAERGHDVRAPLEQFKGLVRRDAHQTAHFRVHFFQRGRREIRVFPSEFRGRERVMHAALAFGPGHGRQFGHEFARAAHAAKEQGERRLIRAFFGGAPKIFRIEKVFREPGQPVIRAVAVQLGFAPKRGEVFRKRLNELRERFNAGSSQSLDKRVARAF